MVGLVVAVGVAALVDGLGGSTGEDAAETTQARGSGGDALSGPDVPPPGALPGVLAVVEAEGCHVRTIAFESVSLGDPGPATTCRAWVSPNGELAVVPLVGEERSGIRELALVRLGEKPEIERRLGTGRGEAAWSRDGGKVAWCTEAGDTMVLELGRNEEARVAGCFPRFAADGSVVTRPLATSMLELRRDGEVILDRDDIFAGLRQGGSVTLAAHDVASNGLLAVTAVLAAPMEPQPVLQLWRDGTLEASIALPPLRGRQGALFGSYLAFSPSGRELAIGFTPGPGEISVVDLELQRLVLSSVERRALAWSPDGAWLALAVGDEVQIFGELRDTPIYRLPISVLSLGWGGAAEPDSED